MSHSTKMSYAVSSFSLLAIALILLLLFAFSMSFSFDDPSLQAVPTPSITGTSLNNTPSGQASH